VIALAQVAGVAVEEPIAAAPGAGLGLAVAGGWIMVRLQRRRTTRQ
jgi:hypothetical protein